MSKPSFVYVIYIHAAPEQVWDALRDPDKTKLFWGRHRNVSDWRTGSSWEHQDFDDAATVDIAGTVLESDPPRRLVLTWAEPNDLDKPEKVSKVTFEIEPFGDSVRLTVSHENLEPDSEMLRGISMGWPAVLSSLKSLLETGTPMAATTRRWGG
jgi:uncharacterized protein YndB with AHSA1/START domain